MKADIGQFAKAKHLPFVKGRRLIDRGGLRQAFPHSHWLRDPTPGMVGCPLVTYGLHDLRLGHRPPDEGTS